MIRAVQLVFWPAQTWEQILESRSSGWRALFFSLLPGMILATAADAYSLTTWGKPVDNFGHYAPVGRMLALQYELARVGFNLLALLFAAFLLLLAARGFNMHRSFGQCFVTLGYGFSVLILSWFFGAIPALPNWICWAFGVALTISVLYHGVALALKPDLTKGFGLYLITLLLFVASSGLAHFAAQRFLAENKNLVMHRGPAGALALDFSSASAATLL